MRIQNAGRAVSIGIAMLAAGPAAAQAVNLVCTMNDNNMLTTDGPLTLELNEAQGLVTVHFPTIGFRPAAGARPALPASVMGPLPARFTPDVVAFSRGETTYQVNRLTGIYSTSWSPGITYACAVGKRIF